MNRNVIFLLLVLIFVASYSVNSFAFVNKIQGRIGSADLAKRKNTNVIKFTDKNDRVVVNLIDTVAKPSERFQGMLNMKALYLSIRPQSRALPTMTWATGLRVNQIRDIRFNEVHNEIEILVDEDVVVYPDQVMSAVRSYRMAYRVLPSGAVSDILYVQSMP